MKFVEYIDPDTKKGIGVLNLSQIIHAEKQEDGSLLVTMINGEKLTVAVDMHIFLKRVN